MHSESISQGSSIRTYRIYTPSNVTQKPGLIIALQPSGGSGVVMEALSGLDHQADRLGWIVVYPNAASHGWTAYGCCGQNNDVSFISNLIDHLETAKGIDPNKVYVTGWSRGAMMSYRLGCELSSKITAIAPVDGNMGDIKGSVDAVSCHPQNPISVLIIHGTNDLEIPTQGGKSKVNPDEEITYAPLQDILRKWQALNGCNSQQTTNNSGISTWNCKKGSTVTLHLISGGDHNWPGSPVGFQIFVDLTPPSPLAPVKANLPFDASQEVADFFAAHTTSGK